MQIKLQNKLIPFSHTVPIEILLPKTFWKIKIYPTLICFFDMRQQNLQETLKIFLGLKGPVKDFTVFLDLERFEIRVRGESLLGYFSYSIFQKGKEIVFFLEKSFSEGIKFDSFKSGIIFPKEEIVLPLESFDFKSKTLENLSFGIFKLQDFDLIKKRQDMREICPYIYRLSQLIPDSDRKNIGTMSLVKNLEDLINKKDKNNLESSFLTLLKVAFSKTFTPRLSDEDFQGIIPNENIPPSSSSLFILKETARLIREMFFKEDGKIFHILPSLPTSLFCGRFTNIATSFGNLDIEWSKKQLRRMIFKANKDFDLKLQLSSQIKDFRVLSEKKGRGKLFLRDEVIPIKAQHIYYFDHFQK
jgi:hypothetical protein